MGTDSGKFYDAAATRSYCEQAEDEYDTYAQNAGIQTDTFLDFAGKSRWQGLDAIAGKHLTGTCETGRLGRILQLQKDMSDLHADVIDKFSHEVDGAADALVKADILKKENRDFCDLFSEYDSLGKDVEKITDELSSRFSRYGSFTKPDFETGRNAFRDLCGGDEENTGYLYECRQKLSAYDMQTVLMIERSGILRRIDDLKAEITASDNAITAAVPLSMKGARQDVLGEITDAAKGAADEAGDRLDSFCRGITADRDRLIAKVKDTELWQGIKKISDTYGGEYYRKNKWRSIEKRASHILTLFGEEIGKGVKDIGCKWIDNSPVSYSTVLTSAGINPTPLVTAMTGLGLLECWQKGEGIDHAAAYAEKDGRSVIRGVYKCGIDCATGMTSIPQMVIDAGYGLEDESEKLLNAVQNYKGSKAEIPGILLRHAEQTGENLYRMGKTFAGSEIDKWNGMSIEERCEAGGYIMGTLALLFAGGEESLSGKAAGEAGEVAGDASRTAETLEKTEKTAEALEKTIAPEVKAPYVPDEEELAMQRIFDEQRQPCEEYEDYLNEIRKHIDEPAPKVKRKGGGSSVDYYVGPNGKVLPSQYKDWIGTNIQEELLRQAENPQLKNAIKQLYRGKSFIGDGGTADVIKFEQETGIMLGKNGGAHIQKGIDMASYLQNKILSQELSATDKQLATKLLKDLNNALGR